MKGKKMLISVARLLPDRIYLQLVYHYHTGKWINFRTPKGFNEKIQWLKLHDHRPEYTTMVDKLLAKEYVGKIVGQKYIVPTLKVWDDPSEIDFDTLPDQFVLKCNHDSGGVVICRDKSVFDRKAAIKKLSARLKKNAYWQGREWPYKNVEKKVFAEEFMADDTNKELIDYKFYCFDGKPQFLYCSYAAFKNGSKHDQLTFFDLDMNPAPFHRTDHDPFPDPIKKPENFDEMIELCQKLSKGIPFVRVDLYNINKQVYFSEFTFSPGSGYGIFSPEEWERKIGDMVVLKKH